MQLIFRAMSRYAVFLQIEAWEVVKFIWTHQLCEPADHTKVPHPQLRIGMAFPR